jgi:Zn-dependent peptidase ImmA (M78 family)
MSLNLTSDNYYYDLKVLARKVRRENGLTTPRVLQTDLRRIYSKYGIEIDYWPYRFKHLRGAFICDELGPTVMVAASLPQDPMVFTMAHELKHFLTDRHLLVSYCDQSNVNKKIEIGAEVFASELLFPDQCFVEHMQRLRIKRGQCDAETIVSVKHQTRTTLSYSGLAIKAERLGYASPGSLTRVKGWKKLEKQYIQRRNLFRSN